MRAINPPPERYSLEVNGLADLRREARADTPEARRRIALQFEALVIQMMMKSMREALPHSDLFSNDAVRLTQGLADAELAQQSAGRGFGFADLITQQLGRAAAAIAPAARVAPKPPRAAAAAPAPAPVARGPAAPHVEAFVARHQAAAESASHITGIPAGYILGQAALESGWGRREIRAQGGAPSYNLFGIKASALWQGKTVDTTTTEYVGGRAQQRTERFRAYGSYAEAFEDYARLLRASPRYAAALKAGHSVEAFAREMGRSGYATDPRYGTKLAQVIHTAIQAIA